MKHLINKFALGNGVTHGSSLSVASFLIAVNEIESATCPPVEMLIYADDIILLARGPDTGIITEGILEAINKTTDWTDGCGFSFNPAKTKAIYFTRK